MDLAWFKSSYSGEEGECVEAALNWTKSSHSSGDGECIETAATPTAIHIRDSKAPTLPHLTLAPTAWTAFLAHATA